MKASTASTLPAEWALLSLTPPLRWCVPAACFWSPKRAVLWFLCFTTVPFAPGTGKGSGDELVLLYRHAVLWASAAVGFSNVGKAAPRARSSLVQESSPCMAIKCHSSWGSVLLSGLVRAFDSCLLMGKSESIPESVLWFSVACFLLYLRRLPFVSMWVFFCPVFLLQLSRPLHWRFQHLGSLVTPSVRRVFSLTEQCKPQFKSKAVRCSSCLQAWSCCLVLIQGLETEMINLQYIKINSFFSGLFLQHRGGF